MTRPIALACSLLLVAACSKKKEDAPEAGKTAGAGSTAPATGADRPPAATGGDCDFAPPDKVSAALAQPGFRLKDGRTLGSVTMCSYQRSETPRSILIRVEKETGKPSFETTKSQMKDKLVEVTGLGDSAFTYVESSGGFSASVVVVLKGTTLLFLTQAGGDLEKMKALAGQIAASF
jgi:hypothetical protein